MSVIIIAFPIIFILDMSPIINQMITAIVFFITIIVTIFVIFIPKIVHLLRGKDIDSNLAFKKVKRKPDNNKIHQAETIERAVSGTVIAQSLDPADMEVVAGKVLHGLSNFERLKVCNNYITMWNNMLLKIGDGSYNSSHPSSHGSGMERSVYPSEVNPGQLVRAPSVGMISRNNSIDNSNVSVNYVQLGRMTPLDLIKEEEENRQSNVLNMINSSKMDPLSFQDDESYV